MFNNKHKKLTDPAQAFLQPANATQRQYEALRAFFVDKLPSKEAARRFGYSAGSFRVLVHHFRQDPSRAFFLPPAKGPQQAPKSDPVRERIVQARKQNLSIYDIGRLLQDEGHRLSPAYIGIILKQEGFARLPRRADDERPEHPRPDRAPVAEVQQLDLSPRQFRTQFGGLFLFLPYLAPIPWEALFAQQGFPGSAMIPAAHAIRALLGLKLYGSARHSHVMSEVDAHSDQIGHRFRFNPDRIPADVGQRSDSIRTAFRTYPDSCSERSDAAGRQLPRHGLRVKPDTGFSAGKALRSASREPADRSPMGVAPLLTGLSSSSSPSAA
ncbi:hypothetical protein ARNL5_01760 [Anaerolineae bacterium]|nr:hypothetical protein ARNL5_01760 [Anaerolineae bacterium]